MLHESSLAGYRFICLRIVMQELGSTVIISMGHAIEPKLEVDVSIDFLSPRKHRPVVYRTAIVPNLIRKILKFMQPMFPFPSPVRLFSESNGRLYGGSQGAPPGGAHGSSPVLVNTRKPLSLSRKLFVNII